MKGVVYGNAQDVPPLRGGLGARPEQSSPMPALRQGRIAYRHAGRLRKARTGAEEVVVG
jgi:hypothetical protein